MMLLESFVSENLADEIAKSVALEFALTYKGRVDSWEDLHHRLVEVVVDFLMDPGEVPDDELSFMATQMAVSEVMAWVRDGLARIPPKEKV